jgi:hypothetical protein
MTSLEWWCDAGTSFVVPAELLTGTFSTRVSNYDATVHLPSVPANARLGSKVDWLPKLGQPLPDGLYESLVDKRNDAVHEGHEVRPADCNTAIAASSAVVEMAYPLPALLGTRQWT